ncbi:hypothetical protein JMF97_11105 [Micromonospora fiedleri]|uniref:Uncharacterized protein n=1 Tax=Micromonospora fiedleri TaxID=1157498 RepID=A0ABS1UK42_9ACTN|nr:hypothetical protein [Micromonospora fiedleri]MBL6276710.1 hypothetical protein [Micromonospora fiedleri]
MTVLDPDGFAGLNQDRFIQDEIVPSIDKGETVSLLTVDRSRFPGCTHGNSIGSIPPSYKSGPAWALPAGPSTFATGRTSRR